MDEDERRELVARLFYVMTARFKNAAALAAEGQGKGAAAARLIKLANSLTLAGEEIAIVAQATAAIVQPIR